MSEKLFAAGRKIDNPGTRVLPERTDKLTNCCKARESLIFVLQIFTGRLIDTLSQETERLCTISFTLGEVYVLQQHWKDCKEYVGKNTINDHRIN